MITRRGFLESMAALTAAVGLAPLAVNLLPAEKRNVPPGDVSIYLNGLLQADGHDYTIGNDKLVFDYQLEPGDIISCVFEDTDGTLSFKHIQ